MITQPLVRHEVLLSALGEALAPLRLRDARGIEEMGRSLELHGQMTPLCSFDRDGVVEIFDGFKRLAAARQLGWRTLGVTTLDVGAAQATARIAELHDGKALTELEQGWIVRSLYREHHHSMGQIAAMIRRDKTWVWRRLMLVEALDPAVQADVRLGLIAPRAALVVSALPRGNDQQTAARLIAQRGLTVRQADLMVQELTDAPPDERAAIYKRWSAGSPARGGTGGGGPKKAGTVRGAAQALVVTITTIRRAASALHGHLGATPLCAYPPDAAELLHGSLCDLRAVLDALRAMLATALDESPREQRA